MGRLRAGPVRDTWFEERSMIDIMNCLRKFLDVPPTGHEKHPCVRHKGPVEIQFHITYTGETVIPHRGSVHVIHKPKGREIELVTPRSPSSSIRYRSPWL